MKPIKRARKTEHSTLAATERSSTNAPLDSSRSTIPDWRRWIEGPRLFQIVGIVLVMAMATWWTIGLTQAVPHLPPGKSTVGERRFTPILIMPMVGLDFHHNYVGVRSWLRHDDLYAAMPGDPANLKYTYPPLTLVAFSWTRFFAPTQRLNFNYQGQAFPFEPSLLATFVWLAVIASVMVIAAWTSWRVRQGLALPPLPFVFVVGATFASYPVIFEIERGNCNALPLLAIIIILPALRWKNPLLRDVVIGFCVAAAVGIKPFSIALALGLVAIRRWRAALFSLGWIVLFCAAWWPEVRQWLEVAHASSEIRVSQYLDYSHALIAHWNLLSRDLRWPGLTSLPPTLTTAGLMLVVALAVAAKVFTAPERAAVIWPFLLWLVALATFISPVAQDYNLLFVPLAVLSLWSRRDPWWIQLSVAGTLLWWQPFYLGLEGLPWLLLKTASVMLVGGLIVWRLHVGLGQASRVTGEREV